MDQNTSTNHAVLIDDDVITLELAARQVRDSDFELVCMPDGDKGIEYLRENSPDVVLVDYRMPRMFGVELIEKLRAEPQNEETRFIIWSSSDLSDEDRARCESAGAKVVDKEIISDRKSFLELLRQY